MNHEILGLGACSCGQQFPTARASAAHLRNPSCGDKVQGFGHIPGETCMFPAGHPGWHESSSGSSWAPQYDHTRDVPPHTHGGTDAPECRTCARRA